MRRLLAAVLVLGSAFARGDTPVPPTLKSVLLQQLKTTHNVQDWFVPAIQALHGLTPEQAMWKERPDNHSIAELVSHLTFWNSRQLAKLKGETPAAYSGKNDETFTASVDKRSWEAAVRQLDDVLTAWEKAVESADEARLRSWSSTIAHISTHNAYHTGQILFIRKQQGSWDAEKGVK